MATFDRIKAGLEQAIAYEQGKPVGASTVRMSVAPVQSFSAEEIKQIRTQTGMTQRLFAEVMGVSPKTIEAWEAGRNKPIGPAGRMLSMMQADPRLPEKMRFLVR